MNESLSDTQRTLQQHLQDFVNKNRQNFEKQTKDLIERKPRFLSFFEIYQEEIIDYERLCETMMEEITEAGERRLDYLEDVEERTACRNYMEEMNDKLDNMKHFRLNFLQNQLRLCRNTLCNIEMRIEQNRSILSDPGSLDVAMIDEISNLVNVEFLKKVDRQLFVWMSRTSSYSADFNASFPEKFGDLKSQKYGQFPEKLRSKLPNEESPILSKAVSSTMIVIWNLIPYILVTLLLMFVYCASKYVFGVEADNVFI